jgi:hypothetical protein
MTTGNDDLRARGGPTAAQQVLDDVAERWRTLVRRHLIALAAAGLAAIWLAAWLVERYGPTAALAVLAVAAVALAASAAWVTWVSWSRRPVPGERALARFVEEHCPSLEERLITAVEVTARRDEASSVLAPAMLADADRAVAAVSLDEVVPSVTLRRAGMKALAAVAACVVVLALWVEPGRRALQTAALQIFPGRFMLTVSPGDARVKPDEKFVVRAHAAAPFGSLVPRLEVAIGDDSRTVPMRQDGDDDFSWTFDKVPASFTYRVSAGGRSSEEYRVTLLHAPRVRRIDLRYEFPAYTRLASRTEEDGGDIYAPAGSRVQVTVHGSKPLDETALVLSDGRRIELRSTRDSTAEGALTVSEDGAYRVSLRDRDGLMSSGDTEYFIRVLDDRPPNVRILRPASDRRVTPLEEVTIEARADDDYGISAFDLVFSVRGGEDKVASLGDVTKRMPTATGRRTLYLEDLGVEPGDFVTYYARARDIGRGKASSEARSDIFFLEVTPFEEEFAAAQSQAMAGAGGDQGIDDLVTAQKNIIVATWKLERRAAAGQSAADVQAVGRAQGELRARAARAAQRASGPAGRRRNPFGLAPAGDDETESSMGKAVSAMGRAEASLKARNTKAAIPAEMEALNHLLKAQAEIRRRQVMRQQASGGGGSNRADQDLSSLFDRELRRQQQTNYETPPTSEERRGQEQDDVLERVRELARRQEQLARQQDELARDRDQLSPEELRRRLERLAREQSELRRQAAQAAKESSSASSSQQSASGKGSAGSELREASEQMRRAASDLRREATDQARARGKQALEKLRSLERSMQGSQPDEQRRALGDLQLEARQLAERQRQLSEQAAAAGRDGDPSSTRRRLAGDQDRAAERAERLQESLRELAGSAGDPEARDEARGAAGAADEHQIARRMRDAARSMRESAEGRGKPEATDAAVARQSQELARALEGVADQLEPGSHRRDAQQQQLAEELAATRRLREELGNLEREIAELRSGSSDGSPESDRNGRRPEGSPGQSGASQDGRAESSPAQGGDLERLQEEYAERTREIARLERSSQSQANGGGMATPEGPSPSVSAPGTEAFKQDFSGWESLHKEVSLRLERLEATLSQRLLERASRERLQAGSADTAPDQYEQAVDRYFRSLAEPKPSTP